MGIKNPIVGEIAYRTWCIDEYGMDALFLIEGDEKALLIDTGTGAFDIKETIAQLTDKPVVVALTHGHVDHAGGMGQFDEIYLHPDDIEMAKKVTAADRKDYVKIMMSMSEGIYDLTEKNVVETGTEPAFLPLKNGDVFDLGNRTVEVYETPGHTPGGLSFLDTKERIIFTGDACNMNTLLALNSMGGGNDRPKSSISDLLRTAELIESLHGRYDRNYNGHIGYANMKSMMPMPKELTAECIGLCKDILSGKVKGETISTWTGDNLVARTNTMQIQYVQEQVK
jgi:glyoxylase-like metal-dependent hydrolase (beta-lactamase superfamily II)